MLQFIQENWITMVTIAVLALIIFLAIRKLVRNKKEGIGACGSRCSDCPHSASCGHH